METSYFYGDTKIAVKAVRKELLSERDGNFISYFYGDIQVAGESGRNFSLKEMETRHFRIIRDVFS